MEATKALKNKVTVIGIISVLLMVSFIGTAYAYSTSVTSSGDISGSYLTVDLTQKDADENESAITVAPFAEGGFAYGGSYDSTTSTDSNTYYVHVKSNEYTSAFLYGYFTVNNGSGEFSGVLIESITVTFNVDLNKDGSLDTMVLYRDAYMNSFNSSEISLGTAHEADLQIMSISVSYYGSFDGMTSVNVTTSSGSSSSVSVDDGKSTAKVSLVFHASNENLLSNE